MEKNLTADHTQEEVDELHEASQIIPEEFYEEKWVRYQFKQPTPPVTAVHTEAGEEKELMKTLPINRDSALTANASVVD